MVLEINLIKGDKVKMTALKLGITGYPLSHSLSPVMQNSALKAVGISGEYGLFESPPNELEARIEWFKKEGFRGFNVTIPHKVEVMKFLDCIDDFAIKVGAVNTVVIESNGQLAGYNTDVYGFTQAIPEDMRESLQDKKAVILGSGGAARAVAAGIFSLGMREVCIMARNRTKADELIAVIRKNFPELKASYKPLDENADLTGVSLVVNTTPMGMQGEFENFSPLAPATIETLEKDALVYDIVYRPRKTKLLALAEERRLNTLDGLDMLVLQGAKAFELWTEKTPPVEVMTTALLKKI